MQPLNPKSLNILFLIYDLERGGPELRLLDFAKHFSKDINMHICVTSEKLTLLQEFRTQHVVIQVMPVKKAYLSILKSINLFSYCKKNNIKSINVFDLKGLIIALSIKLISFFRIKVIYHNVNSLVEFSHHQFKLFSLLLKCCNTCICNSQFSKNEVRKIISNSKIHLIYNGLDPLVFKKNLLLRKLTRSSLDIQEDEIVLGIIANFRKQKNYPFLLKTFEKLSAKYGRLKLLCVGGGEHLEQSKSIVKNLNLNKKVIFTGYTELIVEYLSAIDILVLPSLWEGLPNALLQAMSMEIPVVASNVGGCLEIIQHMNNGIIFHSTDIGEFTTHLENLINDKNFACKLGHNARKTIEERFSLHRMIEEYTVFYEKLEQI